MKKETSNIIINNNNNFNNYYKNKFENMRMGNKNITNEGSYSFIQCRYLDNSFKLFIVTKKAKKKEKELIIDSYSYICEDFVFSCCTVSSNEFLTGLENGKLIRWIIDYENNNKLKINFNKNIQAHRGRINAIEIDERLELIITCGNDNYVQIRKLYNLELLTPIKIKQKYIITMAKVSPINLLYIMCYDRIKKQSVIFGYTLTGIKFAKSKLGLYCNIDFTHSGNIVSLLNYKEICILYGYNLAKKVISEKDNDYNMYKELNEKIKGAVWLEFKYCCCGNSISNIFVYIKKGKNKQDDNAKIYYNYYNDNKLLE